MGGRDYRRAHDYTSRTQGVKFDHNLLLGVDADGDLDILNTEENHSAAGSNPGLGLVWSEDGLREHLEIQQSLGAVK